MGAKKQVAADKSDIVADLPAACSDEHKAVEFMEAQRWPDGEVSCPHCGVIGESRQMKDRKSGERNKRFLWRCLACKRQFTVRVGTVFEDSRIPLRHWCYAFWAACSSKKGVSALQIKRQTGLSYKSALFMMHRIRFAMSDAPETPRPLTGIVEVDETYVGGKPRYRNTTKRGIAEKEQVLGMVERGGELRPFHVRKGQPVTALVRRHIAPEARLMTDEHHMYRKVGREFADHQRVMHSVYEYARGLAHTNTIEGFFSLFKRGLYGTFHAVSVEHLHRYLSEFQYRWNTRHLDDGARTALAIRKAAGRRLVYREKGA
jgi:transposase-like protein